MASSYMMPLYSKERFRHELVSYETEMLLFCDTKIQTKTQAQWQRQAPTEPHANAQTTKLTVRPTTLVLHVQRSEVLSLQTLLVYNLHTGKHNIADSG